MCAGTCFCVYTCVSAYVASISQFYVLQRNKEDGVMHKLLV